MKQKKHMAALLWGRGPKERLDLEIVGRVIVLDERAALAVGQGGRGAIRHVRRESERFYASSGVGRRLNIVFVLEHGVSTIGGALGGDGRDGVLSGGRRTRSVLDGLDPQQSLRIIGRLEVEGLVDLLRIQTEAVFVLLSLGRIGFERASLEGNVASQSVL